MEIELDKFALLEDDRNLNHPNQCDAFLCAKHGKEYARLINHKRCSRPGCWRRGSLRRKDGSWILERTHHMQEHFKDPTISPQTDSDTGGRDQLDDDCSAATEMGEDAYSNRTKFVVRQGGGRIANGRGKGSGGSRPSKYPMQSG